jgi:transcriptional regulator with XRE-family HTH domain
MIGGSPVQHPNVESPGNVPRRDGPATPRRANDRPADFGRAEGTLSSRTSKAMSAAQLRMARAAMNWTVQDLSRAANVAPATVGRIEAALTARPSSFAAIRITLERAGIVFMCHRDGDGVRITAAAECVRDLLELARIAAGKAMIDTALQERLDRFLATAAALQKQWRVEDSVYVDQLKERLRVASRSVEPPIREALEQALRYIGKTIRQSR